MNENQRQDFTKARRTYRKPQIIQIPLRPDEAVLGFCKNGSVLGPGGGSGCATPSPCSGQGS